MSKQLVIVLGGPGSGKGTQCEKIQQNFNFAHLSAGDLLRREVANGNSEIQKYIDEGKIVPSEVTVNLLKTEMEQSEKTKFLIDGFPRNAENNGAFEELILPTVNMPFLLYFECPDEVLEKRLLDRARGDDTVETIRKRLGVYKNDTLSVIKQYEERNLVQKMDTNRDIDTIFQDITKLFTEHNLV